MSTLNELISCSSVVPQIVQPGLGKRAHSKETEGEHTVTTNAEAQNGRCLSVLLWARRAQGPHRVYRDFTGTM